VIKLQSTPFPVLSTRRLHLRKPTLKDSAAYHRILNHPDIAHFTDLPQNPTNKRSERFVGWMSKLQSRGKGIAWILECKTSGDILGAIRINSVEKKALCGLIGYELHPDKWGCGYTSEALGVVVRYAHTDLLLNRLEAWTAIGNDASNRVLEKNHFQHEGTQREKAFFNGKRHSLNLYGRLAADPMPAKHQ